MNIADFTFLQIFIACGLGRGLTRSEVCRAATIKQSYITKCLKDENFKELSIAFRSQPFDADTKEYKGLGTIYMDIGRFLWSTGEKLNEAIKR